MSVSSMVIDEHREYWAEVAKKNGWHKEPFYVRVWADRDGFVVDSDVYEGMTKDVVIEE